MAIPYSIHFEDAPRVTYERLAGAPLDGISRRLITREQSQAVSLFQSNAEGPLDLSFQHDFELIFYGLRGTCHFDVGGTRLELSPGRAVLIPAGISARQTALEATEMLIFWSPAPPVGIHDEVEPQ